MTGKELLTWLQARTEQELSYELYGGKPIGDETYPALERISIVEDVSGEKAIFIEPAPDTEEVKEEPSESAAEAAK